ncbi:MAG TPA: RNB domain-containing ribonuclease [Miltoncostaeaceae bacterium]|nr:RNB domain-containing ribonuclease [Miltoncostaeaceae bacterium]
MRLEPGAADLAGGFDRIREELGIPGAFPPDAEAEARAAAVPPAEAGRADRRDLELVTIDPPGSRDLDQALHIAREGPGFRVSYAIADVGALVAPGGAVDREARERGVTVYLPDRRSPLHPDAVGEGTGSLLPDADRAALLWTIDLDARGEPVATGVARALVRSRRALGYPEVQAAIDAGSAEGTLALLREVGELRLAREAERGGVSLSVPVQEVAPAPGGGYALRFEAPLPVEDWNAQVSLLTGMAAARIMIDGGVGLFRTLAPAEERDLASLRRSALALGVTWPEGARYADVVRGLDPARPGHAAFAVRASRLFRGAGYAVWRRGDGPPPVHAAIAAPYAHVTAPLRRLCDRVANEVVLALAAGADPPEWAIAAMEEMPQRMATTAGRARAAERAAVDHLEAVLLTSRVGQDFDGVVTDVREGRATVQVADPAVVAPLDGDGIAPGTRVRVRLTDADPAERTVRFTLVRA